MRVNRIGDSGKPIKGKSSSGAVSPKSGRKSKVSWLRSTKAGQESMARLSQALSLGASINSVLAMIGVSRGTYDRWIQQGIDGVDDDSIWFLEVISQLKGECIVKAEARVYSTKPLEWLKHSPQSEESSSGWSIRSKDDRSE